jgi:hypothetical protein
MTTPVQTPVNPNMLPARIAVIAVAASGGPATILPDGLRDVPIG